MKERLMAAWLHGRGGAEWLTRCFPVEWAALKTYFGVLAVLLALAVLEYGALYACGVNRSFGNAFLQALPFFLALSAPALFLGRWGSRIYLTLLLPLMTLVAAAAVLAALRFRVQLDGDVIAVIMVSSENEMREFFNAFFGPWPLVATGAGLALCGAGLWRLWRHPMRTTRYTAALGLLLLLPYGITALRYVVIGDPAKALTRVTVSRMVWAYQDFRREFGSLERIAAEPELPAGIRRLDPEAGPVVGVIVIGESANRGHLGIYGYGRDTTPELAAAGPETLVFSDAVSAHATTTWALRYLLTMSRRGPECQDSRCTLTDVLKAGGFRVDLLSNQYRWGKYDGPISMLFARADRVVYLQEIDHGAFDDGLIPLLRRSLAAAPESSQVVFLHLIGSHADAASRYPAGWGPFDGAADAANAGLEEEYARLVNQYDNSVAFTDRVLGMVIDELRRDVRPGFMLYVSDHGEIIDDGSSTLRSSKSREPDAYEVPLVLWLSPRYRADFGEFAAAAAASRNHPIQTDRAFGGMAALARLTWDGFDPGENCFSPEFRPVERLIGPGDDEYRPE